MSTSLTSAPRLRLEFLDGLRGLAALYIVLFHAFQTTTQVTASDAPALDAALIWRIGHPAVSIFIVLSGFCLMLPVVRAGGGTLRGGVRDYLARRARRILPPYYAALVLSSLFLAAAHFARYRSGLTRHDAVLALHLSPGSLLPHVFLVHNLSSVWVKTIDVPMWSVATEWQIYFFFPALLLPVWRRFGSLAALVAAFALSLLPHYLLRPDRNFDWACPWYLGLFAMGMSGAILAFSSKTATWRERRPWGGLAAILFFLLGALLLFVPNRLIGGWVWETDALAGAATTGLILDCTAGVTKAGVGRPPVLQALEARPTLWLGAFSYSLYLVHYPILKKPPRFSPPRGCLLTSD